MLKKINLQLLADGAGDDPAQGNPAEPPADEGNQGGNEQNGSAENKTYSQSEVDHLISIQKAKIPKSEDWKAFKAWQSEQQKAADEKLDDESKARIEAATKENNRLKAENAALKFDVNPDALDDVITLAMAAVNDETSFEDAVKAIVDKYPSFKKTQTPKEQKPPAIIQPQANKPLATGMNQIMNDLIRGKKG